MTRTDQPLTRRLFVGGLLTFGGLAVAGCGRAAEAPTRQPDGARRSAAPALAMTVYRDPSCGCCEAWATIARKAGYQVEVVDHPDMARVKRQYGVPAQFASCHTTLVGDYVVEGHVPLGDVTRLLRVRPADIKGIAVPGMPLGSPGMETPDGAKQPFQVMAFDTAGRVIRFK